MSTFASDDTASKQSDPSLRCIEWAKSHGAQLSGFTTAQILGRGTCLIRADSSPFKCQVPHSLVLNLANIQSYASTDPAFSHVLQEWSHRVPLTARRAAILLMAYHARNPKLNIPWSVYLSSLPSYGSVLTPVFWTETERALLSGTTIEGVAEDRISFLKAWVGYHVSRDGVSEFTKSLSMNEEEGNDSQLGNIAEIAHYDVMVDSRALRSGERDSCIVPVIDYVNHSSHRPQSMIRKGGLQEAIRDESIDDDTETSHLVQNSAWDMNESGDFHLDLLSSSDEQGTPKPGEEILFSYGKRGAAELCAKYGFVEQLPMSRSVTLEVPVLSLLQGDEETAGRIYERYGEPSIKIEPSRSAAEHVDLINHYLWLFVLSPEAGKEEQSQFTPGHQLNLVEGCVIHGASRTKWELNKPSDVFTFLNEPKRSPLRSVLRLRAVTLLLSIVQNQYAQLGEWDDEDEELQSVLEECRPEVVYMAKEVRRQETGTIQYIMKQLVELQIELRKDGVVEQYLAASSA